MSGHQAIGRINEVGCAICRDAGREHGHRAGSLETCKGDPEKGKGKRSTPVQMEQEKMDIEEIDTEVTGRRSVSNTEPSNAP